MITFRQIAQQMGVRMSTIEILCNRFQINILNFISSSILKGDSIIDIEFVKFLRKNQIFIKQYGDDYYSNKTPEEIATKINRTVDNVNSYLMLKIPDWYKNGEFTPPPNYRYPLRYFSSYFLDYQLGGDYTFLNTDAVKIFQNNDIDGSKEVSTDSDTNISKQLTGYKDVYDNISEQLEPILNPSNVSEWGLNNPAGIILFGPPGCGKTYWAFKISKMIGYDFKEIPRSIFGSSYVDGAMINLKNRLDELSTNPKTLIFFDEFDSVAGQRNQNNSTSSENSKVVNTLLQEIPKMIEKRILIVAATNFLDVIDPAVIRPGRFDLKIPIFPPNHKERIELICHELLNELSPNSKLREILVWNKADIQEFWIDYSTRMNLYSNSLIVDFTQLLKKRLRNIYKREQTIEIRMTDELLTGIIEDTSAKITSKDVEFYSQFYNEVKKLSETTYSERLRFLFSELSVYFGRNKKDAPRPIGFRNPRYES